MAKNASSLSEEQLRVLRERLEQTRAELQHRLEREQAVVRDGEEREIEPMDEAEQTREQDDAVLFSQQDSARLREVEHALQKMDAGRYGVSETSGAPIPFNRLLAVPWARRDSDE
jgi:DnaK suppressor protein